MEGKRINFVMVTVFSIITENHLKIAKSLHSPTMETPCVSGVLPLNRNKYYRKISTIVLIYSNVIHYYNTIILPLYSSVAYSLELTSECGKNIISTNYVVFLHKIYFFFFSREIA